MSGVHVSRKDSIHELKVWAEEYEAIYARRLKHLVCVADRIFKIGDFLALYGWDPKTEKYSIDTVAVKVTHITQPGTFGVPSSHCVLSIDLLHCADCRSISEMVPTFNSKMPWDGQCWACERRKYFDDLATVESNGKNVLEILSNDLQAKYPSVTVGIDASQTTTGSWFLDIMVGGLSWVVEWRREVGFGLSTPESDDTYAFGIGADAVYTDRQKLFLDLSRMIEGSIAQR